VNLIFFNPLFLAGLAAAVVPILIHRITRRRAVVRRFAAVRLLVQSQLVTARPQRLKNFLLLALRILAVAAVVLMIARPVLVRPGLATLAENGARVLIVDNSLSMGFQEDGGSRFALAQKAAAQVLKGFGGRVAILPTVRLPGAPDEGWRTAADAAAALVGLKLSAGRGRPLAALQRACRLLQDLNVRRQILVFSDLARSDWEGFDAGRLGVVPDADLLFFKFGGPERDPNARLDTVRLVKGELVAGERASLAAALSNLSDKAAVLPVQLYLDGARVDQKSIALEPGASGTVFFDVLPEETGWKNAEVRLAPDRLAADDTFYVALNVHAKLRVLLVDGDPGAALRESESYYLANALRPGGMEGTPFLTRVVTAAELQQTDLESFDVLCLLNVARPDFSRAAAFLQAGRPVFIFLGNRVEPEAYNRFALAPWRIEAPVARNAAEKGIGIERIASALPFPAELAADLKSASFDAYYPVAGSAAELLTLKGGSPLLLAADVGQSRLYLFTSSADLDWNDLALKAAYLPLIHGLLKAAAGLAGTSLAAGGLADEPFGAEAAPVQLAGAPGAAGIYRFSRSGREYRQGLNTAPQESNLVKLTPAELQKKFGRIQTVVVPYGPDTPGHLRGGRTELWPLIVGFLLLVLAAEMVAGNDVWPFAEKRREPESL